MRGCENECKYSVSAGFGGSLLHRRCELCGGIEINLRDEALGVTALLKPTYEPFDPDFAAYEARRGANN